MLIRINIQSRPGKLDLYCMHTCRCLLSAKKKLIRYSAKEGISGADMGVGGGGDMRVVRLVRTNRSQ